MKAQAPRDPPHYAGQSTILRSFWASPVGPNVALFLLTAAVFLRTTSFGFTNLDDGQYVYENTWVKSGLSIQSVQWAFSTLHADVSYWHPLTWLSHQLDCELFGLRPGPHHLTSVWIHVGNTLLLFAILRRLGLGIKLAFLAAGLFGVHPLHVESVAWIAERKDVLYACFWLSALYGFIRFRQEQSVRWYAGSLLLFCCSLMSKPAAVTLPIVLFLIDLLIFRIPREAHPESQAETAVGKYRLPDLRRFYALVPFVGLSLVGAILTLVAQTRVGAVQTLSQLPLLNRAANGLVAYMIYLRKAVLPFDLCVSYVRTRPVSLSEILFASTIVGGMSWYAVRLSRRLSSTISHYSPTHLSEGRGTPQRFALPREALICVGWFWFVLTLVPNIGVVQVGPQSMADRYMYLPLVGLLLALAGLSQGSLRSFGEKSMADLWVLLALGYCVILTCIQLSHWRNGITLFSRAVQFNEDNWVTQMGLGLALTERRRFDEALPHLERALALPGNAAEAHKNLGLCYQRKGDLNNALNHLEAALRLNPKLADAYFRLADVLISQPNPKQDDAGRAVLLIQRGMGLRSQPKPEEWSLLSIALGRSGRLRESAEAARCPGESGTPPGKLGPVQP
jgi:hypothetical protein